MTRFIALFVALVAGVAAAVWYYRAPANGVPAPIVRNDDRWIEALQSRSPKDVEEATAQLEERGTAALPVIRQTLQDPAAEPARKQAALKATAILGARAADALPDVAAVLQEPEFAPEAALALSFMGSPAVPALQEAVNASNEIVRREALRALGKLRERASIDPKIVVPLLLRAVDDPDPAVRNVAVTYLGIVRDDPAAEVNGLIKALADESPEVRQAAAAALAEYGALAERAIPALKKAASDPDEDVRREAGRTLVHLAEIKNR
ncbi:MAG TPA: HEAT repeat domain-containing protein [Vicinamibacterales bacterium]|nr:HEAT repeat domain-containing protein [Vicinamibacterales bacterium]